MRYRLNTGTSLNVKTAGSSPGEKLTLGSPMFRAPSRKFEIIQRVCLASGAIAGQSLEVPLGVTSIAGLECHAHVPDKFSDCCSALRRAPNLYLTYSALLKATCCVSSELAWFIPILLVTAVGAVLVSRRSLR